LQAFISPFIPTFADPDDEEAAEFSSVFSDTTSIDINLAALATNAGDDADRPDVVDFYEWNAIVRKLENEKRTQASSAKQQEIDARRLNRILYPKPTTRRTPTWPNHTVPQAPLPHQTAPPAPPPIPTYSQKHPFASRTSRKHRLHPGIKPHALAIQKIYKDLGFAILHRAQSYGYDLPPASVLYPHNNLIVYTSHTTPPPAGVRIPTSSAAYVQQRAFNSHEIPPGSALQRALDRRTGPVAYPSVGAFRFGDEVGEWRESMFDGLEGDSKVEVEGEVETSEGEGESEEEVEIEFGGAEDKPKKRRGRAGGGKMRCSDASTSSSSQASSTAQALATPDDKALETIPTTEAASIDTTAHDAEPSDTIPVTVLPPKKKRGRPRKDTSSPEAPPAKKRRGRPPKKTPPGTDSPPTPNQLESAALHVTISSPQEATLLLHMQEPPVAAEEVEPVKERKSEVGRVNGVLSVSSTKELNEMLRRAG
jgi:hypothetical protein